jgi:hypothetical protein
MSCQYASSCSARYACLATISGTTNAHVADCDGTDDYATKVCCAVGAAPPVGGIAEVPDIGQASAQQSGASPQDSGSSPGSYAALAGGPLAAAIATAGCAWYAKRRWLS